MHNVSLSSDGNILYNDKYIPLQTCFSLKVRAKVIKSPIVLADKINDAKNTDSDIKGSFSSELDDWAKSEEAKKVKKQYKILLLLINRLKKGMYLRDENSLNLTDLNKKIAIKINKIFCDSLQIPLVDPDPAKRLSWYYVSPENIPTYLPSAIIVIYYLQNGTLTGISAAMQTLRKNLLKGILNSDEDN